MDSKSTTDLWTYLHFACSKLQVRENIEVFYFHQNAELK